MSAERESLFEFVPTSTNRQAASLACPCCKQPCDRLHEWAYCDSCWYTVIGGDLAPDDLLLSGVTVRLA